MSYMYEVSTFENSDTIHEFFIHREFRCEKKNAQKFGNKREGKADLFFMFLQMNVQKNRQWQSGIFIIKPSHPWRKKMIDLKHETDTFITITKTKWSKSRGAVGLRFWHAVLPFTVCSMLYYETDGGGRQHNNADIHHPETKERNINVLTLQ